MKLKKLKINSYGNLENKEINFDKINIIYGKNESGKSTLLSFIKNMLYGISKNKNGKNISDYDKYNPWNGNNFSGKIKYILDNNSCFEIYRDFNKKNPEIYNEEKEDISNKFKIDKKTGNQFFIEQTNIDENTFMSTTLAMQREIVVDSTSQGILLQKVANLSDSGMEDVSYKKALNELNSMLLNEVGSNNSKERPINIVKANIENYTSDLETINTVKNDRFEIERKIVNIRENIEEKKVEQQLLNKINLIINENKIEKEKKKIKNKIYEENKIKIQKIDKQKNELNDKIIKIDNNYKKNKKYSKIKIINSILILLLIILNIINFIYIKNKIINIILFLLIPIYFIYLFFRIYKLKNKEKKLNKKIFNANNEVQNEINTLNAQMELLKKNNEELYKEIEKINVQIDNNIQDNVQNLINQFKEKYSEDYILNLYNSNIDLLINKNNKEINELSLQLHKLELDKENINPKIEKLLNTEELLEIEKEKLDNLNKKASEFNICKEILEDAYVEMKKNITPKFNQNLSNNINLISKGKYKNMVMNDGIMVELDNGRYVSADALSIGTIEQIYLSLRMSIINELSKEKLPIMLDESFAYYDDERLEAALEFLANIDNQVVLFTCSNREKDILNKLNIKYNFVEL